MRGDVVIIGGTPRTVLDAVHGTGDSMIYVEGLAPLRADSASYVSPVTLELSDALGALADAGLNPEIIATEE